VGVAVGIAPGSVAGFIAAQPLGMVIGLNTVTVIFPAPRTAAAV
jgi:hypothetical protein